jgi:hypothetical protein
MERRRASSVNVNALQVDGGPGKPAMLTVPRKLVQKALLETTIRLRLAHSLWSMQQVSI